MLDINSIFAHEEELDAFYDDINANAELEVGLDLPANVTGNHEDFLLETKQGSNALIWADKSGCEVVKLTRVRLDYVTIQNRIFEFFFFMFGCWEKFVWWVVGGTAE